jgi:hypothetical protein
MQEREVVIGCYEHHFGLSWSLEFLGGGTPPE